MKNKQKKALYWLIVIVVLGGGISAITYFNNQPGQYDDFANCLSEKGATFYGAYWCPACNQQKSLFGKSAGAIPYTECSLPNRSGQNELCTEADIQSYPTWEFADGEKVIGVMTLQELSDKVGCELST
ncbi:MAG: hypothetical protein ABH880_02760 [Patescibacteria group bacterium]